MRHVVLGMIAIIAIANSLLHADQLSIQDIQAAIAAKNAGWTAEENKFTQMTSEERRHLVGALPILSEDVRPDQILDIPLIKNLPDSFDWRDNSGNWITPVKDQGACGSCWAFSALGQVEAWWRIHNNSPDLKIDLSEQFLISCSDAGNCEEGGWMSESLEFIKHNGIALESDLPYQASSFVPCENTKTGWEQRAIHIPDWGYVTLSEAHVDNIKSAVYRYPLSVSYEVFDDFYSYKSGVYEHTFGESSGWHAVVIVGWNDREQSWIVKNSWGAGWGDHGYFRIKWGDSSMGQFSPYIWNETPTAFFETSVKELQADLVYGDIDSITFDVRNAGPDAAYFFANEENIEPDEPNWLTLENSAGYLNINESATVTLWMNTRELSPATYGRTIEIITNNAVPVPISIPLTLTISKPQYDVQVDRIHQSDTGLPLLSWATPECVIKNVGANNLTDFDVVCTATQNAQILSCDTVHVDILNINSTKTIDFVSFKVRQTGDLEYHVHIINSSEDYNDFNNSLSAIEPVTHLVEGFEKPNDQWLIKNGWTFTSALNGYSGSASAHVNGGVFPYSNDMNTTMTYLPGFELDGVDTLFVSYWTRYVTADSNDVCIVETSGDSVSWETVDIFTGVHPSWEQRVLDLTHYAQEKRAKAWIRFQFVSDESGTSIGILIDDVEVYTETINFEIANPPTNIAMQDVRPRDFYLAQNYPNPFNPSTIIDYSLASPAHIKLTIYDLQGRFVDMLVNDYQLTGNHTLTWNAQTKPAGIYFYTLEAQTETGDKFIERKKMLLIK